MTGTTSPEDDHFAGDESGQSASSFGRRNLQSPSEALQPEAAPPPPDLPPRKRRPALSALSGFLSFLLVAAVCAVIGLGVAHERLMAPGPLQSDRVLVIAPHTEGPEIVRQLEQEGIIDSQLLFNLALTAEGNRGNIRSGEYLFKQNASLQDVMDTLVSGKQVLHAITIPEGLTSEQVVQRLRDDDVLAGDIREIPKEGTLLPETYKFERGFSRAALLRKMQDGQRKMLEQVWAHRSPDLTLRTPAELVTLASIVEKETGKADERPRVARVFLNRLSKRMKLQSDPTIVYGLVGGRGTLGRGITRSELGQATPYNTYVIEGLPPGPIANPGRAAIEAVANPSRTGDLYFVADGTGGHVFAESLDAHNKNVTRWRQIEKERAAAAPAAGSTPDVDHVQPQDVPATAGPTTAPGVRGDAGGAPGQFGALPAGMTGAADAVASVDAAAAPAPAAANPAALAYSAEVKARTAKVEKAKTAASAAAKEAAKAAKDAKESTDPAVVAKAAEAARRAKKLAAVAAAAAASPMPAPPAPTAATQPAATTVAPAVAAAAPATGAARPATMANYGFGPSVEELGMSLKKPPPTGAALLDGPADNPDGDPPALDTVPVSPKMRAEMKAKAAKYGLSSAPDDLPAGEPDPQARVASAPSLPMVNGRVRVLDASEGTRLDPLLNKSWDLNSPQTVPSNVK